MSEQKKKILAIVAAVLVVVIAIGATIYFVKLRKDDNNSVETTTESTTATPKATYTVDLEYIQRMLDKQVFTDKFETYTAETFATPNEASKEAYWEGIQQGNTVNPLLLAATSSYLNELGFDTPSVKPSELYDEPENDSNIAELNAKGEQTLNAVKKVIFSDEVKVRTDNLGNSAKAYYNSTPSKEDGIVYASKIGITGNTACWIITINKPVDIDSAYSSVYKSNKESNKTDSKAEPATAAPKSQTKQVIQLCRCGNTVDKDPEKKPEPTTKQPTTKQPTTKQPTTKQPTTKQPTTQPTTKSYIKKPQKDPVYDQPSNKDGGKVKTKDDPGPGTTEDRKTTAKSILEVRTAQSKASTTAPSTIKAPTTKASSTIKAPTTTTKPAATPTKKNDTVYKDDTGKTTVISGSNVFSGDPVLPD